MNYFTRSMTADEIKDEYRRLAKLHHPDLGGDTATMQAINAEYAYTVAHATRREKPGKSESEYADLDAANEALRRAVEAIITLPMIEIEICGLWAWVSGDTRPVKDILKANGYRWASKKAMWYFPAVPASNRRPFDMDEIRNRYGSRKVETRPATQLEE